MWEYRQHVLSNTNVDLTTLTQTSTHWNFDKVGNAKVHWYYYFKDVQGGNFNGLTFTTDQLESMSITMRNNADVGTGQIFFNVYTVGTANGWYENRYDILIDPAVSSSFATFTVSLPNGVVNENVLAIAFSTNSTAPNTLSIDFVSARFTVDNNVYGWNLELN